MGLLFGNVYVKQKFQLQEFASVFSNSLEILVFVLIGLMVTVPFTTKFLLKSLLLFLIMSLNVQKGIAIAVVVFSFATSSIEGIGTILNLSLVFMLYSIILSSIVLRIAKFFIKDAREKK